MHYTRTEHVSEGRARIFFEMAHSGEYELSVIVKAKELSSASYAAHLSHGQNHALLMTVLKRFVLKRYSYEKGKAGAYAEGRA